VSKGICIPIKSKVKVKFEFRITLSPIDVAREIYSEGGFRQFYKGLDSALLRQCFYTSIRFGIYLNLSKFMKNRLEDGKKNISYPQKCLASLMAGAGGSLISNPADLCLIRMQADNTLPPEMRRHYRNVFDAMHRIVTEEGFLSLWKGAKPTVIRAMALNLGMLGSYDQIKEMLTHKMGASKITNCTASACAGFLAAFFSMPFDNIKTKLQRQKAAADGTLPYNGMIDCALKTIKHEGFLGFYAGYPTYFARIAPKAALVLLVADTLRYLFGVHDSK
jgi:solute carrier family 25 (mitochondrial oxoglutarate transporter), member 11